MAQGWYGRGGSGGGVRGEGDSGRKGYVYGREGRRGSGGSEAKRYGVREREDAERQGGGHATRGVWNGEGGERQEGEEERDRDGHWDGGEEAERERERARERERERQGHGGREVREYEWPDQPGQARLISHTPQVFSLRVCVFVDVDIFIVCVRVY